MKLTPAVASRGLALPLRAHLDQCLGTLHVASVRRLLRLGQTLGGLVVQLLGSCLPARSNLQDPKGSDLLARPTHGSRFGRKSKRNTCLSHASLPKSTVPRLGLKRSPSGYVQPNSLDWSEPTRAPLEANPKLLETSRISAESNRIPTLSTHYAGFADSRRAWVRVLKFESATHSTRRGWGPGLLKQGLTRGPDQYGREGLGQSFLVAERSYFPCCPPCEAHFLEATHLDLPRTYNTWLLSCGGAIPKWPWALTLHAKQEGRGCFSHSISDC